MYIRVTLATVLVCCVFNAAMSQQFTLSAPGLDFSSKAFLSDAKLDVIDAQGVVNTYVRDLSYDSNDGQWVGYRSKESGRILPLRTNNNGNLKI